MLVGYTIPSISYSYSNSYSISNSIFSYVSYSVVFTRIVSHTEHTSEYDRIKMSLDAYCYLSVI